MKRHGALRRLSDDHHRALVLARRIRRAAGRPRETDFAALSRETSERFAAELEPHFAVEEQWLLPALETQEEGRLAKRVSGDHARLRRLIRTPWTSALATEFSDLLTEHVRFEERVLFPRAEEVLSETQLGAVLDAANAQAGSPAASG